MNSNTANPLGISPEDFRGLAAKIADLSAELGHYPIADVREP